MKISIVVPIYNVADYLERCIQSLINQTYKNIEIILINDGSTDNSSEICHKYEKMDSRIILFDKENEGLSEARNQGLYKASGEYVLFVDSDDYIEADSCERFAEKAKLFDHVDVISSNAKIIQNEQQIDTLSHSYLAHDKAMQGEQYLVLELKNKTMPMAACLNFYSVDFLKKHKLFFKKGIFHEDEEFTPRVFLAANNVVHLDYCFYNYVYREDSISNKKDLSKNASDLYSTLYELNDLYERECDSEVAAVLKNSLCEKYLYMAQSLHESDNKNYEFDCDFIKRNAFTYKNKLKAVVFSHNKSLYFNINDIKKNMCADGKTLFCKKNIFYTVLFVLNIIFLARFFYLYRAEGTMIETIYTWISRFVFGGDIVLYCLYIRKYKKKISSLIMFIIFFFLSIFIINIIDDGSTRSVISSSYPILGIIMIYEILIRRNLKHLLCVMHYLFAFLLTVNLLQMIFYTHLIGEDVYLLGFKNQLGIFMLISLFVSHLYTFNSHKFGFYYVLFIVIITTIYGGSVNNFLALCILLSYLFLVKLKHSKFIDNLSVIKLLISYIILFVSIVFIHIQDIFSFIIEPIFHRSVSLSGRTYLWDAAINGIKEKFLLGHGRALDTNYFTVDYFNNNGIRYLSAHNTFLQLMYEFGIIPFILLCIFIYRYCYRIKKYALKEMNLFFVILFSMLIILMMEALPFDGLFFLIAIAYFYCLYHTKESMQ